MTLTQTVTHAAIPTRDVCQPCREALRPTEPVPGSLTWDECQRCGNYAPTYPLPASDVQPVTIDALVAFRSGMTRTAIQVLLSLLAADAERADAVAEALAAEALPDRWSYGQRSRADGHASATRLALYSALLVLRNAGLEVDLAHGAPTAELVTEARRLARC